VKSKLKTLAPDLKTEAPEAVKSKLKAAVTELKKVKVELKDPALGGALESKADLAELFGNLKSVAVQATSYK